MLERSSRSHSAICAGDAKEDISVSGTGSCGFESRPAHHHTPLAQLVEHLTFNQDGMGSIPIGRTYAVGSSIGRAPGCGPGGWRFKSVPSAHGILAQ